MRNTIEILQDPSFTDPRGAISDNLKALMQPVFKVFVLEIDLVKLKYNSHMQYWSQTTAYSRNWRLHNELKDTVFTPFKS